MEIRKGISGLKKSDKIAKDRLTKHLSKYGYDLENQTPEYLWHKTHPILFVLCVNDFGVKFMNKKDTQHLIDELQYLYRISIDWMGKSFYGLTL